MEYLSRLMVATAFLLSIRTTAAAQLPTITAAAPTDSAPRIISADFNAVKGIRSQTYRECVGAGRVGEGLRADWQAQLKKLLR